ncbi:hypothetical protein F8388_017815 [Cannabis sativa]|uniref:RNA ligase/cyclic nucleotide phosphodiesterase family protein n=1 Tax=Cannabis sativa TaxID=3483 RepID=A0A7J6F5S7_CANSA|nr:hypothetical protein G4B88_015844 [Cannabis sativa]KAF4365249.1 hypothetical protein F8388_017815 [Cannabis sativa]
MEKKEMYSVWAIPPDEVVTRVKKLMEYLRAEFGGPQFQPHITVVRAISLSLDEALNNFRSSISQPLKAYNVTFDPITIGSGVLYLPIHPTTEFGIEDCLQAYMPHLSILYADLTEDEMKKARDRANILDDSLSSLSFPITRLALYKTDPEDKTLESWEKIFECNLEPK